MADTRRINLRLDSNTPSSETNCERALQYVHAMEHSELLTEKFRSYRLVNSAEEKELKADRADPQSIIDAEAIEGLEVRAQHSGRKKIVLTLGCQGTGGDNQELVAAHMDRVIKRLKEQGYEIACVLVLGDNVYSFGASKPDDSKINKCCENMYARFTHLRNTPFFYIQGNHDQNRHRGNIFGLLSSGIELGLQQVAHTYMPDKKYRTVAEKIALFNQKIAHQEYLLNTEKLSHFNMPGRAYSLIVDDMEIFCIDSNTYVKDYLDYKAGKPGTQAEWLEKKFLKARAEGKKPILALHHPPYTLGNRFYGNDIGLYLKSDEKRRAMEQFQGLIGENETYYNAFIRAALVQQHLEFDTIFAAHDHSMYYYKNGNTSQIVSAGGGGGLQHRYNFENNENLLAFLDSFGFVVLESDLEKLNFAFYTLSPITRDYPLMFNNKSHNPVRDNPDAREQARIEKYCLASEAKLGKQTHPEGNEKQHVAALCAATKTAINRFMGFMACKQRKYMGAFFKNNFTHDHEEIKRAHSLMAYLSSPHIACFDQRW